MNLIVEKQLYDNIIEIWVVGSHSVEVITKNHNHYRIVAQENIRSGSTPPYNAICEKLEDVKIGAEDYGIWVRDTSLPWQNGNTIEDCIRRAMGWINERR